MVKLQHKPEGDSKPHLYAKDLLHCEKYSGLLQPNFILISSS